MHKIQWKTDKHGRVTCFCACCGYTKSKKSRKPKVKKGEPALLDTTSTTAGLLMGHVSLSARTEPPGQRESISFRPLKRDSLSWRPLTKPKKKADHGLLGQLKGYFKSREYVIPNVYRHFDEPPDLNRHAVVYEGGPGPSHKDMRDAIHDTICLIPGSRIVQITYFPQSVTLRSRRMKDRWVVELDSLDAVDFIVEEGFMLNKKKVKARLYDDVMADEYKQFQGLQRMMNFLIKPGIENSNVFFGSKL